MPKTVTVTGADGTLFHLAARYYGDASEWLRILQFNDLDDFLISGTMTLTIPDRSPIKSGGIPQQ